MLPFWFHAQVDCSYEMFGLGNSYFIDCKCHPGILEHFRYYKRSKFYVKTRVDVIPFHVQVKDYM